MWLIYFAIALISSSQAHMRTYSLAIMNEEKHGPAYGSAAFAILPVRDHCIIDTGKADYDRKTAQSNQ